MGGGGGWGCGQGGGGGGKPEEEEEEGGGGQTRCRPSNNSVTAVVPSVSELCTVAARSKNQTQPVTEL